MGTKERRWLDENSIEPEWLDDWTVGSHAEEYGEAYLNQDGTPAEPTDCLGCIVTNGNDVASLWCIDDPDRAYMREIEEDLASELMASLLVGPPAEGIGL